MIARMRLSPRRLAFVLASLVLVAVTGCRGLAKKHEANHIPQFGDIDAESAG